MRSHYDSYPLSNKMFSIVFLILHFSYGAKLVEYRFSYNYGQIFRDFSGNLLKGVNGNSYLDTINDALYTDRGLYFFGDATQVKLPPNDFTSSSFTIPSTFSVIFWLMSGSGRNIIFYRYASSTNYFYVSRKQSSKALEINFRTSVINTGILVSSSNTFDKGIFYIDVWKLLTVQVSGVNLKGFLNTSQLITYTMAGSYAETGAYGTYISSSNVSGYASYKGFVWYFVIVNDVTSYTSYMSASTSINCFTGVGSCTSCNPAVVDPYWGTGCISDENSESNDAYGNLCPLVYYGCSSTTSLICEITKCKFLSCELDGAMNACYCIDGTTPGGNTCICSEGYYFDGDVCLPCFTECKICLDPATCETCIASNATPDIVTGCYCNDGYYGTAPLSSTSSCIACYTECATCTQASICLTCIANNASPDSTQGCNCESGYYGISPINTQSSCMVCDQECSTCNESLKCLTCIANNASPDITQGCNCDPGYFGTSPINTVSSCVDCDQECLTCNESLKCLTCIASNSSPDTLQGCKCDPGFYGTSPLTLTNSCTICNTECTTCDQDLVCLTCIAKNSTPNTDSGCRCNDGYYQGNSTDKACEKCDEECSTCNSSLICGTCIADHAVPNSIQGCECEEMYYGSKPLLTKESCILCSSLNSNCKFCDLKDSNICLQCLDKYEMNEGLCEACDSAEFFNKNTKRCESCSDLCLSCTSASDCQICPSNSHLSASGLCECDSFYNGTVACICTNFTASITIDKSNVLTIHFSEELRADLEQSEINLTINGKEMSYTLSKIDSSTYTFTISSISYTESNALKIVFIKQLMSTQDSYLGTSELNIKLFVIPEIYTKEELNLIKYYSSIGTAVGVSIALGASFTNLDLSSFFNFINCAEIYAYAAIYNLDMDEKLKQFLFGLRIVPGIPTFFDFAIDKSQGVQMSAEYNDFGFPTNLFLVNQGALLSIMLVNFILTPVILQIKKTNHPKVKAFIKKVIEKYKYNFYCRLWIQFCLEGTMAAALTIRYSRFKNMLQVIDFLICACFIAIQMLLLFSLFAAIKSRLTAANQEMIDKIIKKYSTYFEEFKTNSGECCYYYVFFVFRRIAIILLIFLIPQKEIQLSISLSMALAVIYM